MKLVGTDEIRFDRSGKAGIVTLTRPKALNALTHGMVKELAGALTQWSSDESIALVVIQAEGRAFCAGGDIMDVYRARQEHREAHDFFADEYRMNAQLAAFSKPYVSLIDGIVMGGGVGISVHGSHRVMTENGQLAMPEVGIGFFPDVGGSYVLSRLRDGFGMYLALTGGRIRTGDALWSGLATHFVPSADLGKMLDVLCETGDVEQAMARFSQSRPPESDEAKLRSIGHHFSHDTLDAILDRLSQSASDGDAFAKVTLETILTRSPTSLKVTFAQIREGRSRSMEECMEMEFRILRRMLAGHDFYEGIRAAIIEKGAKPVWTPSSLKDVSDEMVSAYFAPLRDGGLGL